MRGKATRKPIRRTLSTTVLLTPRDREAAARVVEAGWATTTSGAIRYALKLASEQLTNGKRVA